MTVNAVLGAVSRILKRDGAEAITTNRIAEVAGVSIGSIYQYFPDKRAIFLAMHERHGEESRCIIENTLVMHAAASLRDLLPALLEAMVDAHAREPELHELLSRQNVDQVDGGGGLRLALQGVISSRARELAAPRDLERVLFVIPNMMDVLIHGAVLSRPKSWSVDAAKEEAAHAISAYLREPLATAS
jgi:AcrR family transcriptional regulator